MLDFTREEWIEFLDDLRSKLIVAVLALSACTALAWWQVDSLMSVATWPYASISRHPLLVTAPAEAFFGKLKLALFAGLLITFPCLLTLISSLLRRRMNLPLSLGWRLALGGAVVLFFTGALFGFGVILPMTMRFFLSQGEGFSMMVSLDRYFSFVMLTVLSFGVAFELPVVMLGGLRLGLWNRRSLLARRGPAWIALAMAAAILTPGADPVSMSLLLLPLLGLFEGTLFVSQWTTEPPAASECVSA